MTIITNLCLHKYLIAQNTYKGISPIYQLHTTTFEQFREEWQITGVIINNNYYVAFNREQTLDFSLFVLVQALDFMSHSSICHARNVKCARLP